VVFGTTSCPEGKRLRVRAIMLSCTFMGTTEREVQD
jgi:hypothetical protein